MKFRSYLSALEGREFRLLFAARMVSVFGNRIAPVAIAFAVLDLTGSVADLGLVVAAGELPAVLLMLVGGVWADRLPRQKVMLIAEVIAGIAQALTAGLLLTGVAEVWQLATLQFVWGSTAAFFHPAQSGIVPQTVPAHQLQQANAFLGFTQNLGSILGPAAAGVLVAVLSPGHAVAVDAATFFAGAWFIALMRPADFARGTRETFLRDLREGWTQFKKRAWLWISVVNFATFHLFSLAPLMVLGPLIANQSLGGASGWATILTVGGIGQVVGGVVALRIRPKRPLVHAFVTFLAWTPQVALLAARAPVVAIAAAAFLGGVGMSYSMTLWFTTMQEQIPPNLISRLSAYDWAGSIVFFPIGLALAGPAAVLFGAPSVLYFAAVWNVVVCLACLAVPGVRRMRRPEVADTKVASAAPVS